MFWNEKIECMSREELEELQLKKLQKTVKLAFNKIPYYNKKYTSCGVFPEDIETLKDIEKLPFITKDDLRESYPYGLFAVDMKDIKEIHSSSGTTGKPVVSGYTRKDLDTWAETTARGLGMMGVGENDIIVSIIDHMAADCKLLFSFPNRCGKEIFSLPFRTMLI